MALITSDSSNNQLCSNYRKSRRHNQEYQGPLTVLRGFHAGITPVIPGYSEPVFLKSIYTLQVSHIMDKINLSQL